MWKPCWNSTVDDSHLRWQHKSRSVTQRASSGACWFQKNLHWCIAFLPLWINDSVIIDIYGLIGLLFHILNLMDSLVDCVVPWVSGSLIHWYSVLDCFVGSLFRWFPGCLFFRLIDSLTRRYIDSFSHRFTGSSVHCFIDKLSHCFVACFSLVPWFVDSCNHRFIASLFHAWLIHWSAVFLIRWFVQSSIHGFIAALIFCICWFIDSLILW